MDIVVICDMAGVDTSRVLHTQYVLNLHTSMRNIVLTDSPILFLSPFMSNDNSYYSGSLVMYALITLSDA